MQKVDQKQCRVDEGVYKCDVQCHFVWRRRRLCFVVAVAEERHQEERTPEDEVGHRDDDEHLDASKSFVLHLG